MRLHPSAIIALSQQRLADLHRSAERERRAALAREHTPQPRARPVGSSLRLAGGRWVHLRHDSA
jgi:hypothetical protein